MPSTKAHDAACSITGTAVTIAGFYFGAPPLLLAGVGCFLGVMLSPDLDWDGWIVHNTHTGREYLVSEMRGLAGHERKIRRVFGKVQRRWPTPFRQWWGVYALVFRHRGWSHLPFVGILTRLCWLFFIPFVLAVLFPTIVVPILAGLTLVDLVHVEMDAF